MKSRIEEILSRDRFEDILQGGRGYIIITDFANPTRIHKVYAGNRFLTKRYFTEKVIQNKCRNGHYYWVDDDNLAFSKP